MIQSNCQNCCKQYICNRKECKQVKWSETKNYGEVKKFGDTKNFYKK